MEKRPNPQSITFPIDLSHLHPMVRRLLMVSSRLTVATMDWLWDDYLYEAYINYTFTDNRTPFIVEKTIFFGISRSGDIIPLVVPDGNQPVHQTIQLSDEVEFENALMKEEVCDLAMRDQELKMVYAITQRKEFDIDGDVNVNNLFRLDAVSVKNHIHDAFEEFPTV